MWYPLLLMGILTLGTACSSTQTPPTYIETSLQEIGLEAVGIHQGFLTTGVGNKDQVLMRIALERNIESPSMPLYGLALQLETPTNAQNLQAIKVYATESPFFNGDKKQFAQLLAQKTIDKVDGPNLTFFFDKTYTPLSKTNYLWLTADIATQASAGDTLDIALTHLIGSKGEEKQSLRYTIENEGNPQGETVIYEKQTMLFNPWDDGSEFYRIPALIALTSDKTGKKGRLVSVTDRRFQYNWDLPNHIDLVLRKSDDNGQTWSRPQTIAGYYKDDQHNQGPNYGYGDAALVETANGRIVCMMAADHQYQSSTSEQPIRMYFTASDDAGETWTTPKEITSILYESVFQGAPSPLQGVFVTSGKGLCLSHQTGKNQGLNGRILFSMVCKFLSGPYQNYILYSDDEGETWKISATTAYVGGDEAKLVEESDGTVLLSTRRSGERGFNRSLDGGNTWGEQYTQPAIWGTSCNADMLIYDDNLYFHTILNAQDRRNLTLYASTDRGKTWPYKRVINQLPAAYSTLVKCADGHLGIYYEDGTMDGHYSMNFLTLPIDWIVPQSK